VLSTNGRLFQTQRRGRPDHGLFCDRPWNVKDAERSQLRELMTATRCNPSAARYCGAVQMLRRCTVQAAVGEYGEASGQYSQY